MGLRHLYLVEDGERPTFCFFKSSKVLPPVAMRALSKIHGAKDDLG